MDWKSQIEEFKKGLAVVDPSVGRMLFRMGLFGGVGSGKSVTSCIIALAATPAPGLIGIVDGENSRSKIAIDEAARLAVAKYGGTKDDYMRRFKVVNLDPPFNPLRVVAAGEALIAAGCVTIILDVLTQVWDSSGGYLDMKESEIDRMTGGDDSKRQKNAQVAAAHIKPWTHGKLIHWIEECKAALVLCFQAKQKWNPKINKIDENETPIQESGITRTAIAVGRVWAQDRQGGYCDFTSVPGATKYTSTELLGLLPNNEQFTFDHADKVVRWFNTRAGGEHKAAVTAPADPAKERSQLAKKLSELLANEHKVSAAEARTDEGRKLRTQRMEGYLLAKKIIQDGETLGGLTVERLREVVTQTEKHLTDVIP